MADAPFACPGDDHTVLIIYTSRDKSYSTRRRRQVVAGEMHHLHHQLRSNLEYMNKRIAIRVNKKRVEGPTLKEEDKVYLWRRNIKTKRQNSKFDFSETRTSQNQR
jgi:hypothetical protein